MTARPLAHLGAKARARNELRAIALTHLRTTARRAGSIALAALVAMTGLLALAPSASAASDGNATAWVRAAHLVPGLGAMRITLTPFAGKAAGTVTKPGVPAAPTTNGMRVVQPAAKYGQASDYRQIPQGLYAIQVRPVNAPADSTPLLSGTLNAQADQAYTLAALGSKSSPRVQVISDDLRLPKAGKAKVRLLPASTNAQRVTVTAAGGPTLAENAEFGKPTGYAAVPAGTWSLKVFGSSPARGAAMRTTSATGTLSLDSGSVYTVLVLDQADGSGLRIVPLLDAASVGEMPAKGVQTGGGGTAPPAATSWTTNPAAGLSLAGAGALTLLVLALRRRPRQQPARGR